MLEVPVRFISVSSPYADASSTNYFTHSLSGKSDGEREQHGGVSEACHQEVAL